ncbi:hypothetical protein HHK36_022748 [Tetracentron sinense]|uniref:EDR1/CTR1/ARMC3-like peptidase-like domain-containing protein n=1 Tax=Tetracentron sinense TaxID=13715 RepID=A0A834YVH0_TETSI|nr:hypothetical protein HHK36_022748 [Tetracentron sinense]
MKHIFKKLHFGSSHDPNRSNDNPPSLSPSCASDHRSASGQSPASPSSSSPTPATPATSVSATAPIAVAVDPPDYFSSEEEFQVQLALAISASNSEFRDDRDNDQIRAAKLLSLGRHRIESVREGEEAAESLSRRYWVSFLDWFEWHWRLGRNENVISLCLDLLVLVFPFDFAYVGILAYQDYSVLDYGEKVADGFYDVYTLTMDPASQGKMPSLADLQTNLNDPGFEVVIVNRSIDSALKELEQVAHCIALDFPTTEVGLSVQRLADIVTDHMGGPVRDANIMMARWMERITELRASLHTSVLPIGSLNIGLSRHRALLFKVNNVGIPCRLVKGCHYTGTDDDAVNIIKLDNEREFLVDLMAEPGTLIPADILSTKDTSFNSYNPRLSKTPTLRTTNDSEVFRTRPDPSQSEYKISNQKFAIKDNITLDRKSSSEMTEWLPSFSSASSGVHSSNGNSKSVIPQLDHLSSMAIATSSWYKGNRGGLVVGDGVKENFNVVPYSQNTMDDSKNLFADLNPFQIEGSDKTSVQNKSVENKINDFQKRRENLPSGPGRPPLPMTWKNRSACNEVPRTKQYEFVEGLTVRNNREANDYNPSSLASSSSIYPEVPNEVSGISYSAGTSYADGDSSRGGNSVLKLGPNQYNKLPSDEGGSQIDRPLMSIKSSEENHYKEYHRDAEVLQHDMVHKKNKSGKNVIGKHDPRKCTHDRFMGSDLKLKDRQSSSSHVDASTSRLDPMLDDVAEWEIPWEDLVIGERIGLGSYGEVYHADWNGTEVAVKKFLDQDFSGDALDEFRSEVNTFVMALDLLLLTCELCWGYKTQEAGMIT